MGLRHIFGLILILLCRVAVAEQVDFARDVRPIFERSCIKCHGAEKQKGGLRLDRAKDALSVLESGKKSITAGKPDQSELMRRVMAVDADERMPSKGPPLEAQEVAVLRKWIEEGASWPEVAGSAVTARKEMVVTRDDREHWAYRKLHTVPVASVKDANWGHGVIDRFILSALEARGIRPNAMADRRTLIRRVYFDVLGLPPTPKEVEEFVADASPDAYEKLVERVLASPHYGERWGRHWLDVARYADSDGLESDADRPNAFQYRDFVIKALNSDMSYQTFVRWQLAGDEYEPENPLAISATGFITGAPCEFLMVPMVEEKLRLRFNELDDQAATTAQAFLGLTLGCARCHDHKFDAIPTRDYYRIQCAFTTTSRDNVLLVSLAERNTYKEQEAAWNERMKVAQKKVDDWVKEQKKGREKIKDEELRKLLTDDGRAQWDELKKDVEAVKKTAPKKPPAALAIVDTKAEPEPTFLLDRGNFNVKKEQLALGFLTVLSDRDPQEYWAEARKSVGDRSTGQRRALAEWITDVDHGAGALLARVMVNRVWQHHFGEGLVRTVNDFGVRGEMPTHPELMEWLANEFVAGGWKLKSLHRAILNSSSYMQSTDFDEARANVDPDDRLLWRRRPQRLEAEVLRDSVLAVSGTLNEQQFGPAFKAPIPKEAMQARNTKDPYPMDVKDSPATRRRTVYMFHKRVVQHPMMQAFDGPDAQTSCGRRSQTTVAPQALALLNDSFMRERAMDFAKRLMKDGTNEQDWVKGGFEIALGREPTAMELAESVKFVQRQIERRQERKKDPGDIRLEALADFAQAIFGLNEFIYVD